MVALHRGRQPLLSQAHPLYFVTFICLLTLYERLPLVSLISLEVVLVTLPIRLSPCNSHSNPLMKSKHRPAAPQD